eukprot:scaffold994_cov396-Pavlova_lutheri.AAC.6
MLHFCSRHDSNSIDKLYSLRFRLRNCSWFRHSVYSSGYKASAKFKTLALATRNGDSAKRFYLQALDLLMGGPGFRISWYCYLQCIPSHVQ